MQTQTGYETLLRRLYRQTINLSDDDMIRAMPAFKELVDEGSGIKAVLEQEYAEQPTRAVMLLLREINNG